ncbi:MAG: RNA-binding S4 domain-containing protein [Oscillospiraceae bacterium]|nr:RNA-binding S4 domain-containing protein [Oscillospiraceae bacterium]
MKVRVTKKISEPQEVPIQTEYIKLESLLKLVNAAGSGGMAKNMIVNGDAEVNGEVCTMRGKKLRPGDQVVFLGNRYLVTAHEA